MSYVLWDAESGNLVCWFATKQEALATVAAQIEAFGREAVAEWGLFTDEHTAPEDEISPAIYGDELADMALQAATDTKNSGIISS